MRSLSLTHSLTAEVFSVVTASHSMRTSLAYRTDELGGGIRLRYLPGSGP